MSKTLNTFSAGRVRMRGGGRVRGKGRAVRGGHGQRRTTFRWNQSNQSWSCHQPWLALLHFFFCNFFLYLQIFLCMWTIWRILYNLNYFSIMAKHTTVFFFQIAKTQFCKLVRFYQNTYHNSQNHPPKLKNTSYILQNEALQPKLHYQNQNFAPDGKHFIHILILV